MGFQRLNILIADDQPGVRYLLDALVREEGHNPVLAANGLEAVELAERVHPHLVFMDIRMPVMDGAEAIERIRAGGFITDVVVMTAFTEKEVIDKAMENGAVGCIIKPFDVDEIRSFIRQAEKKCAQVSAG